MGFHILLGLTGDFEVSLSVTTCFEETLQINNMSWIKFHPIREYTSPTLEKVLA